MLSAYSDRGRGRGGVTSARVLSANVLLSDISSVTFTTHCRDNDVVSLSSLREESESIQHAEDSKDWDDLEEQLEEEHRSRAGGNLSGAMAETKVGGQRLHACSCEVTRFLSLFYKMGSCDFTSTISTFKVIMVNL